MAPGDVVSGDRFRDLDAWIERGDAHGVLEWIAYHAETLDEAQDAAERLFEAWGDDG
jgi:hypothetical protein